MTEKITVPSVTETQTTPTTHKKAEVTCFTCHFKGHKSPQCQSKPKGNRKVQLPSDKLESLQHEELFGKVGKYGMSVTCDPGAPITVVPIECVEPRQFTGRKQAVRDFHGATIEGDVCNVIISIADREFERKAVAIPGKQMNWTPCLHIPYRPRDDMMFILDQMDKKFETNEKDRRYLPPTIKDKILASGLMVSEGEVVPPQLSITMNEPEQGVEKIKESAEKEIGRVVQQENKKEEEAEKELELRNDNVDCLAEGGDEASALVEVSGDSSEGSAGDGEGQVTMEGIHNDIPKTQLAQATLDDESLRVARNLAKQRKVGYHESEGIVFRSRIDKFGSNREQICLPAQYRSKCLRLAHTHFGHQGRNKMVDIIRPFFYWPSLSQDCQRYIKGCDVCQRMNKSKPPPNKMQLREVVSIPFERVAIDLVGPFPTATGGFRFRLTCIDLATKWPEAIPLKTTTSKVIINQLTNIFCRCGFPTAIVSDNGPQFTGKLFQKWLTEKGIEHVKASPYHPQGNGIVERLHRTLNSMIGKITVKKGNWASVVPMALYFVRCSPCESTNMSPFMARQKWEPNTPIQLLYKSWAETDLGEINFED